MSLHPELFEAKPIQPRQPAAWKLAASTKAMARRIMACRRVSLCPLEASRLPAAQRRELAGGDIDTRVKAIKSYFVGIPGAYALDWALDLLERPIPRENGGPGVQLPGDLIAELFVGYCIRRAPDLLKGVAICYDANRWHKPHHHPAPSAERHPRAARCVAHQRKPRTPGRQLRRAGNQAV